MKKYFIFFTFCFSMSTLFSQTTVFKDSMNLNQQFDYLIKKSNRYQDYRVVKKTWLFKLKKNVNDSLNIYRETIGTNKKNIALQQENINSLTTSNNKANASIEELKNTKESVSLLGVNVSKLVFKIILYSVIGLLTLLLAFFVYKYKKSNSITKETLIKLSEAENEHEDYRRRALEREQKIMRKLQDEINKQKRE